MIILTTDEIIIMHGKLVAATGGSPGIRDFGLLESAVLGCVQTFGGEELFPTAVSKIARLAYGLVSNHPFADGNKRIGTYVMLVLLELNSINANFSDEDVIFIGLELASAKMTYEQLLEIIVSRII